MNAVSGFAPAAGLEVDYADPAQLPALLADPQVLAVFGFQAGDGAPASDDPRYLQVGLQPEGEPRLEVWRGTGTVRSGREADGLAWASDGALMFGALQIAESRHGGILEAGAHAYARLLSALPLDQVLKKLSALGLDTVEFGTGNYPGDAHCKLSMLDNPAELAAFKSRIADAGFTISALSSHGNPLHPDAATAQKFAETSKKTILLAEKLGV
ncbi:MAG: hypothetical protein J0H45_00290, partial [Stenotrophomonas nitritireducens]|nr:hypothetical protein [Stenotrophomonas nitritireducens]